MREIKFRAWYLQGKSMIYLPIIGIEEEYSSLSFYADEDSPYSGIGNLPSYPDGKIKDYEIMQYTGLKDKNGKEIYEEDILYMEPGFGCEWKAREVIVKWLGSSFWVIGKNNLATILDDHNVQFEIIGNIYENPELLKEKPE